MFLFKSNWLQLPLTQRRLHAQVFGISVPIISIAVAREHQRYRGNGDNVYSHDVKPKRATPELAQPRSTAEEVWIEANQNGDTILRSSHEISEMRSLLPGETQEARMIQ